LRGIIFVPFLVCTQSGCCATSFDFVEHRPQTTWTNTFAFFVALTIATFSVSGFAEPLDSALPNGTGYQFIDTQGHLETKALALFV
jgi:hypothetical protein